MSKMNELHVVFNAMSLRPGGGLTVLLGLMDGLARTADINYRMSVICSADDTKAAIEQQGIACNVESVCRNKGIVARQLWATLFMPSLVRKLGGDLFLSINQYVSRIDIPQVVYHLNLLRFMPIDSSASLQHRIAESFRNRGSMVALSHANANVFESDYLRQCARELSGDNSRADSVIHIGLPDNWTANRNDCPSGFLSNKIVSITNANDHKDSGTLIKLVAELQRQRPAVDWQLVIIGGANPEKWKPYQQLAVELGVREQVQWLGFVNQNEITSHLKQSLCLVSTSLVESFCMVALESMARGCPAIVSNCTSMPESVGDAAILAEPGNVSSFADAVLRVHNQPELRAKLVQRGFERINQFGWLHCGQKFTKLFKKITSSSVT